MEITEREAEALKLCAVLSQCVNGLTIDEMDKYRAVENIRTVEQIVVASAATRSMPKLVKDPEKPAERPLTIAEIKARNLGSKNMQIQEKDLKDLKT